MSYSTNSKPNSLSLSNFVAPKSEAYNSGDRLIISDWMLTLYFGYYVKLKWQSQNNETWLVTMWKPSGGGWRTFPLKLLKIDWNVFILAPLHQDKNLIILCEVASWYVSCNMQQYFLQSILTIRLDSVLELVLALPKERSTVNAAAKCLKASVSGPPPATSNNCRNNNMDVYVLPEPLLPVAWVIYVLQIQSYCCTQKLLSLRSY
jgi:hypothetical protein